MQAPSVSFVSLGCPKNLVDSEKMLGLLAEAGCPIVSSEVGRADVLVVNTCGFLAASREEAVEILRDAARQKREGAFKRLVVAGCLVQRDGQGLLEQVPEIDALVGVHNRGDIVRAVMGDGHGLRERKSKQRRGEKGPPAQRDREGGAGTPDLFLGEYHPASWIEANRSDQVRLRLTPQHYAYLRMSEGCSQKCTFCTIPSIRGPLHSKGVEEILAEARELIEDGAVELLLIGQDTTSYGRDIDYRPGLSGLLREMNRLEGIEWIRLMYAYPTDFTDDMIAAIAECDRVVKYIDLPLQHINNRILRAMHRRVTREETELLLTKLRQYVSGFGFDAAGVFAYSNEPGTPSFRMQDQLPPGLIQSRVQRLMLAQQEVAFRKAAAHKGERLRVLIDDFGRDGTYPARHQGQAPEVDSMVHVEGGDLEPGQFAEVRCTGSRGYDLLARAGGVNLPIFDGRSTTKTQRHKEE